MLSRRSLLLSVPALTLALSAANAFEIAPYDAAKAKAAIDSGKPVVLHVYAPWCLQCHMQASILDGLKTAGSYDKIAFFRVVSRLDCPRSTVIAYKGGKEVKRMSWGMTQGAVEDVLKAAL
jgi:thiol-disulfide isomerase/thioredoxin